MRGELSRKGVTRRRLWVEYRERESAGLEYSQFCTEFFNRIGQKPTVAIRFHAVIPPRLARSVPFHDLMHLSLLGWEHINLTGDYQWEAEETRHPDWFRPLRIRSASVAMAA